MANKMMSKEIEAELRHRASLGESAADIQSWLLKSHGIRCTKARIQWRLNAAQEFFGEAARATCREVLLPGLLDHLAKLNEIAEEARDRRKLAMSDFIWVKLVAEEIKVRDKLIQYMGIAEKQQAEAFGKDLEGRTPSELHAMLEAAEGDIARMKGSLKPSVTQQEAKH